MKEAFYLRNNPKQRRYSKMSAQTSENKLMNRRVVILGIVCIILLDSLVGAILVFSSIINEKDKQISALSQQITSKDSDISLLSSRGAYLDGIVNLANSTIWVDSKTVSVQPSDETVWNVTANYAGYVSVQVSSPTVNSTYVQVIYSSHGVDYDNQINVGESGTAVFPVLPASIQIVFGNTSITVANATVTITYNY
jgi:hypothetical protein